jgi:MFS family permease
MLGILSAALPLGAVVASPFVGVVGDRWGRRFGIFLGGTIMLIGGVIQGASVHFVMFLMSRFILGTGLVFANSYAPILIGELAHPADRQVITSLYQTSWYLGAIAAAWTTFGTFSIPNNWSWRIPSLLQALPAVIQMVCVWSLPESPRWLIAKGRHEQAKKDLVRWHGNGNGQDVFVELEFKQMRNIVEAELNIKTTWKTLIATPGNRKRLAIMIFLGIFSQWSGNG